MALVETAENEGLVLLITEQMKRRVMIVQVEVKERCG